MVNITRSGDSVLVTSFDNSQFPWSNGELSVPLNSMYFILEDETDFIVFKSVYDDSIMFTALIDEIHVNDVKVTRDTIIELVDNVINSSGGGGSASAGVNSINGFQGDVNIKSINGESLIGSGDITIEGGGTEYTAGDGISIVDSTISNTGVTAINLGEALSESFQKKGIVKLYSQFYDNAYEVAVNGTSVFGIKPVDDTILLENAGYSANGNFRCGVKVNTNNFKTINGESIIGSGDITIEGGSSGGGGITEETDPIFEAWKDGNAIAIGGGATASGNRANAIGTESKATSLWANAFGYKAEASQTYSLALGTQAKATALNAIAIGYNTSGATSGGVVIGNSIGIGTVGESSYKTNINNVLKGDMSNYAYVLNEYGNYVRIPTEWTGTQSEYDALGTYYDNITYNIIEG